MPWNEERPPGKNEGVKTRSPNLPEGGKAAGCPASHFTGGVFLGKHPALRVCLSNPPQPKTSILGEAGLTWALQSHWDAVPGNPVSVFVAKRANIVFARDSWGV